MSKTIRRFEKHNKELTLVPDMIGEKSFSLEIQQRKDCVQVLGIVPALYIDRLQAILFGL